MLNFPIHYRSPHFLAAVVIDHHQQSLAAITGRVQSPAAALARQDLVVLLSDHTGLTQDEIGEALGCTGSTVSHMLRQAKATALSDEESAARLAHLRACALALPTEIDLLESGPQSPEAVARRVVATTPSHGLIDSMALSILTAIEVLRVDAIADREARRAALGVLTKDNPPSPIQAQIIPLKGKIQ